MPFTLGVHGDVVSRSDKAGVMDGAAASAPGGSPAVSEHDIPHEMRRLLLKIRSLERLSLEHVTGQAVEARPLEPIPVRAFPLWKRVMDIGGALAGLAVAGPLLAACVLAIRLTSPGPAIFRQVRGGRGGRPFTIYKLRTMVQDAESRKAALLPYNERSGAAFKMTNDPRVTWVGRFLRRLSLDELPQLYNVLRGDMSLVGPRPLPVLEERAYSAWQRARLAVKPGITGLWQVTSRDRHCFDHWVRLDLQYIRQMSPRLDVIILLKTLPAVLSRRGAH